MEPICNVRIITNMWKAASQIRDSQFSRKKHSAANMGSVQHIVQYLITQIAFFIARD